MRYATRLDLAVLEAPERLDLAQLEVYLAWRSTSSKSPSDAGSSALELCQQHFGVDLTDGSEALLMLQEQALEARTLEGDVLPGSIVNDTPC